MLCILSPAKTMISAQNIAVKASPIVEATFPFFAEKADILVDILQSKSKKELKEICSVSDAIAIHVKALYDDFRKGETSSNDNARYNQAALMFDGPAFRGTR